MSDVIDDARVYRAVQSLCDLLSQGDNRGMSPSWSENLKTEAAVIRNLATEDLEPILRDLVYRVVESGTCDGFPESFKWECVREINDVRDMLR